MEKQVLAVDFGASGGRVMLGEYSGSKLTIENLHRFSNDPVVLNDTMYWDFLRLFHEVKQGILKSKEYGGADSIAIDTWGVDFGLIDDGGRLVSNPVHYRDGRTAGYLEKSFGLVDKDRFYQVTGNQFMEINTAFQLLSLKDSKSKELERAKTLLLMPDLFQYFLSGEINSECSIASTTQLFDMRSKTWAWEIIDKLGISRHIFRTLVKSGTVTGTLLPSIQKEIGISSMHVIAAAGHDTQSALAAVPAKEADFAFLSCGTWSLLGTELREPIINEESMRFNITNEFGVGENYSFLKNIIGLWLIQECRRQWIREGREYSFGQLEQMAGDAKSFVSFVDPDAPEFVPAGNMPERIREFCKRTRQPVPETVGEVVCCINQSLALTYKKALREISRCTKKTYSSLYLVGGGAQSQMLCQMTANACDCTVIAGPVEATVLGNVMVQYMAAGEFSDLKQARQCLAESVDPVIYEPKSREDWRLAFDRFCRITENGQR